MRLCASFPAVVALPLLAACQQPPQFTAQDEAVVRALADSVVADVRTNNMDAWAARFAEDARFFAPNAPVLSGRAAILNWGKSLPPIASFAFGPMDVTGEGNIAYGWSSVFVHMTDLPADTSKQLVVFRRDGSGRWWVQAVAISSDLPLPPAAAAPAARRR